jgi:hypothetical protein
MKIAQKRDRMRYCHDSGWNFSRNRESSCGLDIQGVDHTGYYFSVTDKAPDPGEYRYMTHAAIGVGNLLLSATILHRVKESESVKDALFMLREAKQSAK